MTPSMSAATYKARQTEAQFQATVVKAARTHGWLTIHFPDMLANPSGFPDLILLRRGVCLFVELKRENGKLGPKQAEWIETLDAAGFPVRVWRPSDWDEIEQTLREAA
jgi:hypothetical protein